MKKVTVGLLVIAAVVTAMSTGCLQAGGEKIEGVYAVGVTGPANYLAVYDTTTFEVVKTIPLSGRNNHGLRTSPNGKFVSVCSRDSDVVIELLRKGRRCSYLR
jgi:hypothetical protein